MSSGKTMVTAASLATAVLIATSACAGESAGGQVTLRFAYWGSDVRQQRTEEAIRKFEARHPHIDVVGEFSGFGGYYDRLATNVAGGSTPDVITIEIRGLREYAERGTLADLSGEVDTAGIDSKVLATGAIGGKQFAIPTGVNAWCLVADPEAIEAAGQRLPDDATWTWEEYIRLAARITARTGGKVHGTQQAFNPAFLQIFAAQRGEPFYDGSRLGISAGTIKAWWAVHRKLIATGGSPDAARSIALGARNVDGSLFATGNGAMGMWWSNEFGAISRASGGKKMELLRMPKARQAAPGGMFLQPAMFYTASAKSAHQAEAAEFIDFMVNDPEAGAIILSDRGLPANSNVLAAVRDDLPEADKKTLAFLDEIRDELADPPAAPPKGASAMEAVLKRYTDEVLFGRMPADAAARKFITEANALIAG
ncbi:multiple sugar transport system substrate-binding protein [Nonomuraea thailandensis]|uniref:Multiple sugar transport system substrate-binding protein n=1 Tax=Nonomuraea thailandensis TaxID=1188745 RepID=A0A9X2JZD6_9ACTN|nr:extracellular solute-binding protein [Nonomuraea thailandensis]MCP2354728.1 multiple sugar transport system substrate-binding protein [Nonomuraea thailandensis]